MKRILKATLKVALVITLIIALNFILDLIMGLANWTTPILLAIAIIALIVMYYFEDKGKKNNE